MSILCGGAVLIVLIMFLGISVEAISAILLWGLGGISALIEIFFIYILIKLIATTKVTARFTRIAVPSEKSKIEFAFYKVKNKEYQNIFPCEVINRDKIYVPDKGVEVRIDEKHGKVYDRNAFVTIVGGFIFFTAAVTATIIIMCVL